MRVLCLLFSLAVSLSGSEVIDRARQLYQEKHYDEILALLEPVAQGDGPDQAEASRWIGRAAKRQKQVLEAIRWFEKAVGLRPQDATLWVELGGAYGLMARQVSVFEKLEWARKCDRALTRAVELAPTDFAARAALIDFCLEAPELAGGGRKRAQAEAERFRAIDEVGGVRLLVVLLERERRLDEALALCREALLKAPEDYALGYTFGRTAALAEKADAEALRALQHCLTLMPPPDFPGHAAVWYRMGDLLRTAGRTSEARDAYLKALELDPTLAQAREALDRLPAK
ncbi:tetratricopeptide repeat protein [Nibricoccus sp. IMCC34717]|uniref:tetratricopeptide repeat protein n=1 Tax=Nibricoccus sp. IMCC34717 TaxID=3034021 RepID=UPI00384CDFE3